MGWSVIVGFVEKLDKGVKGGEVIPMNFNNGGFVFQFNAALKDKYTGAIENKVNEAIASFKAKPGTVNYTSVDYSKL